MEIKIAYVESKRVSGRDIILNINSLDTDCHLMKLQRKKTAVKYTTNIFQKYSRYLSLSAELVKAPTVKVGRGSTLSFVGSNPTSGRERKLLSSHSSLFSFFSLSHYRGGPPRGNPPPSG